MIVRFPFIFYFFSPNNYGKYTVMPIKYDDEKCYEFHDRDTSERCFLCNKNAQKLFIVRHIASSKMVHLCGECMVDNLSEFMLDNTRPWMGQNRGKI